MSERVIFGENSNTVVPKVQVILSTYNGEAYLREQLDSILKQDIPVQLLIRDDGSTDGTRDILEKYKENHTNIRVCFEENVGVIKSFFRLLEMVDKDADYVAFADQDDVWKAQKVRRAVQTLSEEEEKNGKKVPLAYCSDKTLVDERLTLLPSVICYETVRTTFGNALVENMCSGCTCVINRSLLETVRGRIPAFTIMHDFWIYMVGTCFGKVIYDDQSFILYRQHGKNAVGAATTWFGAYRKRFKTFRENRGKLTKQAEMFLHMYEDAISEEKKQLLLDFISIRKNKKARKRLLRTDTLFRQRKTDCIIMRTLLRMGLL